MKTRISVPCLKTNLQRIRQFIVKTLRDKQLPELDIHAMVLAVDEVCANLMIHANKCSPRHSIEVNIDLSDSQKVVFDIIDHSQGFDIRQHPEPDLQEIIKNRRKGGLGLMLVKRIMDDIDFEVKDNQAIVRLAKRLPGR